MEFVLRQLPGKGVGMELSTQTFLLFGFRGTRAGVMLPTKQNPVLKNQKKKERQKKRKEKKRKEKNPVGEGFSCNSSTREAEVGRSLDSLAE